MFGHFGKISQYLFIATLVLNLTPTKAKPMLQIRPHWKEWFKIKNFFSQWPFNDKNKDMERGWRSSGDRIGTKIANNRKKKNLTRKKPLFKSYDTNYTSKSINLQIFPITSKLIKHNSVLSRFLLNKFFTLNITAIDLFFGKDEKSAVVACLSNSAMRTPGQGLKAGVQILDPLFMR